MSLIEVTLFYKLTQDIKMVGIYSSPAGRYHCIVRYSVANQKYVSTTELLVRFEEAP